MKKSCFCVLMTLVAVFGCASAPTPFQRANSEKEFGYRVLEENGLTAAVFVGNNETSSQNAKAFAVLAAFEYCRAQGKFALTTAPVELVENRSYKHAASGFRCMGKTRIVDGPDILEDVSSKEVERTKFQGGVRVKSLDGVKSEFKIGDIIVALNKKAIRNAEEYYNTVDSLEVGANAAIILRSGKILSVNANLRDETVNLLKISNEMLSLACKGATAEVTKSCQKVTVSF